MFLMANYPKAGHAYCVWLETIHTLPVHDYDNDNILFDHNIQIEIIMYNSLENQIIDWSGDYY